MAESTPAKLPIRVEPLPEPEHVASPDQHALEVKSLSLCYHSSGLMPLYSL